MPRILRSIPSLLLMATLALTATLAAALPLAAQEEEGQEPQAEFRGEIEVNEVALDVLVTDADGNSILGLGPSDFQITDGNAAVEVTSATFYSNRSFVESGLAADRLGVSPTDIPVDRYFILFFDDQRGRDMTLVRDLTDAVRWAKHWVQTDVLLNDWVAVLTYDVKLKVHTDFTRDTAVLLEALDAVAKGSDPGANWPSRQPGVESEGPSLTKNLPQGKDLAKKTRRQIYSGLRVTAEAAGYIVGRKNLMLFSVGFGRLNDVGTYLPDERFYPPMMETLNDNNVAVYAISLQMNQVRETPEQSVLNNGLSLLASDTDGRYYFNFNNFRVPMADVVQDNNGYYLVTYKASIQPESEKDLEKQTGQFREVEVTTTNPEFKVRARKGYYWGS